MNEYTPQGLLIHSVENPVTGQTLKYVFAVFLANGIHKGLHAFMPHIHPATTRDGQIFDMIPGELYPISLDRYPIAVDSRNFAVPHLHTPGDNLLRDTLREIWKNPATINGTALYEYVDTVGGFLQPLDNVNSPGWEETIKPAPEG